MRRAAGVCLLLVLAGALAYGYAVTQRERAYRTVIERGDEALGRDDSYAAIEAFSVAISLKSDSMAAHLKRGEAYRRRSEFEAALRDLRRAADLDPLAPLPRELLGDVHYTMAGLAGQNARARFTRALERYRESVSLDDGSPRVQYKLGLASYRAGQLPGAITALQAAIRLDERFAEAHYMLGVCLRAAQQTADAVKSVERAVALAPAFLPAREELADAYARLERHEDRLNQLLALLALQPGPARERALGIGYAQAGHLDRAVAQLGHAVRRYPDDAATYVALGRLWLERAETGGRVELNKALQALQGVGSDSSSEALTLLGRAHLLAGDLVRAEKTLQAAAARFPVDPEAFLFLARAAERRAQVETAQRALVDYAALVGTDVLDVPLLLRLAEAYTRGGNLAEARRVVALALQRDPDSRAAAALQKRLAS
ncbi:MAG TPA: tetratricopeptide repeat protein [Vicinamibacterales bacterium]|nr:tetratricopeptide repeat protein [Vicinamibacterales bacterium]